MTGGGDDGELRGELQVRIVDAGAGTAGDAARLDTGQDVLVGAPMIEVGGQM